MSADGRKVVAPKTEHPIAEAVVAKAAKPTAADYLGVGAFLLTISSVIAVIINIDRSVPAAGAALIRPMQALVGLTAVVWLLMVVVRNTAVMLGRIAARYFIDYAQADFDERIERPARAFNNLFQVPMLFYVVCLLMMVSEQVDRPQVALAWLFVGLRVAHAIAYIGWNHLPSRFATWLAGCITLGVLWARLALP